MDSLTSSLTIIKKQINTKQLYIYINTYKRQLVRLYDNLTDSLFSINHTKTIINKKNIYKLKYKQLKYINIYIQNVGKTI